MHAPGPLHLQLPLPGLLSPKYFSPCTPHLTQLSAQMLPRETTWSAVVKPFLSLGDSLFSFIFFHHVYELVYIIQLFIAYLYFPF